MNELAGRTVLVVDDEPANFRLLRAILGPEGPTILHAMNGEEALRVVAETRVDLLLLDVLMPGIDGIEVCLRLRARDVHVPIILVTALADTESRVRGKSAGADDFLTKPIHEDELIARARTLLRLKSFHEEVEHQRVAAEREARRWRLVSGLACAMSTCRTYEELLGRIIGHLRDEAHVEWVGIVDVREDELAVQAAIRGTSPEAPRGGHRFFPAGDRKWLSVLSNVDSRLVSRNCESQVCALVRAFGLEEAVLIPVEGAGELHQVVLVGRASRFDPEDAELLATVARHIGNAVNNIRLHLRSEALLRFREEMTQHVVHDLRNLVGAAGANVELAILEAAPAERASMLDDAQIAIRRLMVLVADLLDAGAAEDGQLRLHRRPTNLALLATEVLRQVAPAVARQTRVSCADVDAVDADVDADLIRRVIENIVANAIRYLPSGGAIEVRVGRAGPFVELSIANDGPPITADVRQRLFQRYAGHGSSPRRGNTRGLGLYFCGLVVEAHGGRISAAPLAEGARFDISLPASPTARSQVSASPSRPTSGSSLPPG